MYRLATIHTVTERQTYNITMPITDHTACSTIGKKTDGNVIYTLKVQLTDHFKIK